MNSHLMETRQHNFIIQNPGLATFKYQLVPSGKLKINSLVPGYNILQVLLCVFVNLNSCDFVLIVLTTKW